MAGKEGEMMKKITELIEHVSRAVASAFYAVFTSPVS